MYLVGATCLIYILFDLLNTSLPNHFVGPKNIHFTLRGSVPSFLKAQLGSPDESHPHPKI